MCAFGANVVEVIWIACGFLAAGHKKKGKEDEGWVVAAGDEKKHSSREREHSRSGHMWTGDRQQWRIGWSYGLFLAFVQERQVMREGGDSGCSGGGRRQRRSS